MSPKKIVNNIAELKQLTDQDVIGLNNDQRDQLEQDIVILMLNKLSIFIGGSYFHNRSVIRFEALLIADIINGYQGVSDPEYAIKTQKKLAEAYIAWYKDDDKLHDAYHVEVVRAIYHNPELYKEIKGFDYVQTEYPKQRFFSQLVRDVIKYIIVDPLLAIVNSLVNSLVVAEIKQVKMHKSSDALKDKKRPKFVAEQKNRMKQPRQRQTMTRGR